MKRNSSLRWINVILLFGATACSQVSFSPTDPVNKSTQLGSTPGGPTCGTDLGTTKELTKMLFIVDTSGSNQGSANCTLGPNCTDANKVMRAGSITRFFTHYGNRPNFNWAFENFSGTTSTPLITDSGGMPIFSDAIAMQNAITSFRAVVDSGGTPYMAALNLATQTITNDPDLHSAKNPQYIVVFMSDGQPDAGDTASTIVNQVSTLVGLKPGRVSFNAVYYGTGDAMAAGLLQSMSQIGHGNFLNTSVNPTGLDFEISDLVNIPCQ